MIEIDYQNEKARNIYSHIPQQRHYPAFFEENILHWLRPHPKRILDTKEKIEQNQSNKARKTPL